MLDINCIVCTDNFIPTAEVFATRCGHLFHKACILPWLRRSETCPQCRNNCTAANVIKVYFNVDSGNSVDHGTVNELLDSANLKINESEKNRQKANERIKYLTQAQYELKRTINDLKEKEDETDCTIRAYFDEVRRLKKEIGISQLENNKLQANLQRELRMKKNMEERLQRLDCTVEALENELRSSEDMRNCLSGVLDTVNITFSHLKWLAHEKARIAGWKFVWARDGKILARKNESAYVFHIACPEDLCQIA